MIYYGGNDYRDYLAHHGIVGMRWGIRRYQPYPGEYRGNGKFIGKKTASETADAVVKEFENQQKRNGQSRRVDVKLTNKELKRGTRPYYLREAHTIPKGTTIYRVSTDPREPVSGEKYVSYLDVDRNHYHNGWVRRTQRKDIAYEHAYELQEDINVPSRQELSDVINDVVKKNKALERDTVNKWLDMTMDAESKWYRGMVEENGREVYSEKKYQEYVDDCVKQYSNMTPNQMYFYTAQTFGTNKEIKSKVIDELKKRGYNAMTDEASVGGQNGFGAEGGDPLVIFDGNVLQRTGTMTLKNSNEVKANRKDNAFREKVERRGGVW